MLDQYKTMGLAAAACMLLGVNSSDAAVTLTFQQVGPNVTATWSGSYLVPALDGGVVDSGADIFDLSSYRAIGVRGLSRVGYGVGVAIPTGLSASSGIYVGNSFGFDGNALYSLVQNTLYFPVGVMTIPSSTLASLGADAFDNTLAFTGLGNFEGNREIRFNTIPEPSCLFILGLGTLGLACRRRKR